MKAISLLLLACFLMPGVNEAALRFHVAPDGDDAWSGQPREASADRRDGPFASLEAALQAVRALSPEERKAAGGVRIVLRGGVYELEKPVVLGPEDSGVAADQPMVIENYPGEKPILSGGRRITGWERVDGRPGAWRVAVPGVKEGRWYFRQLFVNGQRAQRARTPNDGYFRIQGESPQDKPVKLKFAPGDIRREWADRGDVEVIALLAWADIRMQIRSVDEAGQIATLSGDPRPSNKEKNARYFIENTPDALDAPGEWYLDRESGVLTYWALPGQDLTGIEVVAPRLEELMRFQGDLSGERPVAHVVLRGVTFSHTDWTLGENGYADTQAAIATPGDIRAEGMEDCVIEDCVFSHLAGYAVELGRGCRRVRIVGNEMVDLGAGGVRLGEPAIRESAFEANHGHVVSDNHMHALGRVYPPAVGVFVLQSGGNRITHNHIHDLFYTAISVGWNWGYRETPCRENVVEFNHLHDIGQARLSDMGAVYTLGIQKGTVIRNNLIHDVDAFTYGGWGLYPDEGSTDILWENNVVYRTKSAGFHQHYGRDNVVRNNIFAFGREFQVMRTRAEAHRSFVFTNNIVYFNSGKLLGSNWSNDNYLIDGNLYFDARPGATPESMVFAGVSLEQWRQRGHDLHSVVADPLFEAPEKGDFRLRSISPALQMGFRPIDMSSVGPRPRAMRN
ncbi:MAG: right-handed parallel beta-helix repeat-containing protein [Verrucomicrobia bacterium]|nr:right-handed parallel beta-helix repeat-containing protein [Verrucomicrobiota bacterium]